MSGGEPVISKPNPSCADEEDSGAAPCAAPVISNPHELTAEEDSGAAPCITEHGLTTSIIVDSTSVTASPAEEDSAAAQCIADPGLASVPIAESTSVTASPCAVIKSALRRPSDVS